MYIIIIYYICIIYIHTEFHEAIPPRLGFRTAATRCAWTTRRAVQCTWCGKASCDPSTTWERPGEPGDPYLQYIL